MKDTRREAEIWEIVNKERRKRKRIDKAIKKEEWKEYFMGLLDRVKERVMREDRRHGKEEERYEKDDKKEVTIEEIRQILGKIKDRKAVEIGEISIKV